LPNPAVERRDFHHHSTAVSEKARFPYSAAP